MGRFGRILALLSLLTAGMVSAAVPAMAQEAPASAVTLTAAETSIPYGAFARLSGQIATPEPDQTISLWTTDGTLLNQVTTDEAGAFEGIVVLEKNTSIYAQHGETISPLVDIGIIPKLDVRLENVRLFSPALISGSVSPSSLEGTVEVELLRNGKIWRTRETRVAGGRFKIQIPIGALGSFRARAEVSSFDYLRAEAVSESRTTKTPPYLSEGARGDYVLVLERRLDFLGYHIDGINRHFDYRTADAMRAFNKVNRRARNGFVDQATWRALASPVRPTPRAKRPRFHIEVDQTRQVLFVVRRGKVTDILHVSTGAGSATRDGVFRVTRKLAGYSGNRLYYPSYFDGLRAFHGWPSVPTYNASHGCVRVPMWSAQWIYGLADIGTQVRIYH